MFRTLRNLVVNIMAAFIRDRDSRHKFRNKYKKRSKFRKLRDDNRRLFNENKTLRNDIVNIKSELSAMKTSYNLHLWEWERVYALTFHVEPLNINPTHVPNSEVFLAIACVSKNEGPYLREWIEYHKIVGVERFYFYDNESDDNTKEVLEPYIKDGTVVYHFLPNHPITKQFRQIEAYNDAIFKYREKTRWMAIIDIDEFIVPVERNSIPEFLADFEQYPAVVINWVCFDSNGHDKKPTSHGGLLTANYTRVKKDHNNGMDRVIKSIVNPKQVVQYICSHYGIYYLNFQGVTENFLTARGMSTKNHSTNKIRINHYKSKSREEYINRITKNSINHPLTYKLNESVINFKEETAEDFVIQKYVPTLKTALGILD